MPRRLSSSGLAAAREFLLHPDRALTGADIARATGIGPGTLYPLLARMVENGWLVRTDEMGDPSRLGRPLRRFHALTPLGLETARNQLAPLQMEGTSSAKLSATPS